MSLARIQKRRNRSADSFVRVHTAISALLLALGAWSLPGVAAEKSPAPASQSASEHFASPPSEWFDPATGHRIVWLSQVAGSNESFYFHQNAFTEKADKMVFFHFAPDATRRLFVIDLQTRAIEPLSDREVSQAVVGAKGRKVYYLSKGDLCATHLDTHETKVIARLPLRWGGLTVNADETLVAGTFSEGPQIDRRGPKSTWFDKVFDAKQTNHLYTVEIATGRTNIVYSYEGWLNHVQFSPTDPGLLMFCHEGPWHKLDRIWQIRTDGSGLRLVHKRTAPMEIAGHEFWSPDGKTVWFDLQVPRGETFFLAGADEATGKEIRYPIERDQWSVHYNISRDQTLFAGDGGAGNMVAHATNGKWLYLFEPRPNATLRAERLCNMAGHDYALEPNVNFTPDGKWIVFRSNMHSSSQVYMVEVRKL